MKLVQWFSDVDFSKLVAVGGLAAALASSSALAGGLQVKSAAYQAAGGELTVYVQDKDSTPNACDYSLTRFEYLAVIDTLVVNLAAPDHCSTDRYGQRQGVFKWTLPSALRSSASLTLLVNGEKLGTVGLIDNTAQFTPNPAK